MSYHYFIAMTYINSMELTIPENAARRESVFASHDPALSPSAVDDVRPVPVPRHGEGTSAYSDLCCARALFSRLFRSISNRENQQALRFIGPVRTSQPISRPSTRVSVQSASL